MIFRTASESLWNDVHSEAQKLIKSGNKIAYQAAYRLLSSEGSQEAYELRQTLPNDLFPLHESLKQHQKDPCISWVPWTKEECQLCIKRTDIELHWISERIQPHCIDPNLEVPDNFGNRLKLLTKKININLAWSSFYKDSDDHFFEQYEPALCAYAPYAIADLVKSIMQSIFNRSEIGIRQLSFHVWENYLILGEIEKNAIYQAWQKFEKKSNIQENLEQIAAARLFRVVLELLEPEQQLDYLLQSPDIASEWLYFERSFKPIKNIELALLKLNVSNDSDLQLNNVTRKFWISLLNINCLAGILFYRNSYNTYIRRILWFLSTYPNELTTEDICQHIYPFLENEDSFIRSIVLKIIY